MKLLGFIILVVPVYLGFSIRIHRQKFVKVNQQAIRISAKTNRIIKPSFPYKNTNERKSSTVDEVRYFVIKNMTINVRIGFSLSLPNS